MIETLADNSFGNPFTYINLARIGNSKVWDPYFEELCLSNNNNNNNNNNTIYLYRVKTHSDNISGLP